MSHWSYKYL